MGSDTGSIVDTLQVFDSSSPVINVAVLRIYVCQTPLAINPAFAVVSAGGNQSFVATSIGVGSLTWTIRSTRATAPSCPAAPPRVTTPRAPIRGGSSARAMSSR